MTDRRRTDPLTGEVIEDPPIRVTANLRYRIDHGNLLIGFKLPELVRVVESAFNDVVNEVSAGLLAPVFIGKP